MRLAAAITLCAALPALGAPAGGLRAVRVAAGIQVDGRLNERDWARAPMATGFTQEWPLRSRPAHQRTEVRVLFDDHFLYVGARMHHDPALDKGPADVVKRLHRRDQDSLGDWFGVAIDSNHDHRTAMVFEVNAAGVQKDQVIYNDGSYDVNWDGVWESAVTSDEGGWTAELKIPLSLLRFKPGEQAQSWGINFSRVDQGLVRESSRWMVVPRGGTGYVSHFPPLEGLEGLSPQPRREVLPYLSAARKFETARTYDDRHWEGRGGLDARWGLSTASQIDLSVRPDFGQVEVDQAVLNLGTVETFFPEKRPFFLEGMDIFRVAGPDLLYTRRIGQGLADPTLAIGESLKDRPNATDILAAAKYTAKYPTGTQVGLLAASVEPARATIQDASGQEVRRELWPHTAYGILRVQQVVDERGSYVGLFASAMDQAGPTGREAQVQALDSAFKSEDRSRVVEVTASRSQTGTQATQEQGWRGRLRLRQEWKDGWALEAQAIQAGRAYNPNDLGYLGRADERRTYAALTRAWDRSWGPLLAWSAGLSHTSAEDQAGHTFQRRFSTWGRTDFVNFFSLWGGAALDLPVADDRELRTYADPVKKYLQRPAIPSANLGFDTPANRPWYLRLSTSRAWAEGGPTTSGTLFQSVKPATNLELQLSTSLTREEGGRRWMETPVATPIVGLRRLSQLNQTLRVAYAFTPRLTVQFFSQWLGASWHSRDLKHYVDDRTLGNGLPADQPVGTSPQTAFSYRAWNLNLITRWEFRPGSTFFFVYTHGANSSALANDHAALVPGPDLAVLRHLPSDDVIQAKVSWLFR